MNCGEPTIDGLLAGDSGVPPLQQGANGTAVGHLQDLLRGHGFSAMPDPRASAYGSYGSATEHSLAQYRSNHGLAAATGADRTLMADMVRRTAPGAVVGAAYVSLVLDMQFQAVHRFIWLTSLFETRGVFGTLNLNTDQCGLSFGILQWAQKPGQLHKIFQAIHDGAPGAWSRIIGDDGVLAHTAKPNGGVNPDGTSVNPAFELTKDPWKSKVQALGADRDVQRVQLSLAQQVYQAEISHIQGYAGQVKSERGYGFLLDLANQFGGGRVGVKYKETVQPGDTEAQIFNKLEDTFANIARQQFRPQVRARRDFFRTTPLLSDAPFTP